MEPEIHWTLINSCQSELTSLPAVRDGFISKLPLEISCAVVQSVGSGFLSVWDTFLVARPPKTELWSLALKEVESE